MCFGCDRSIVLKMKLAMSSPDDKLLDHKEFDTVKSTEVITRIAGICGLIAVALGAYGFHGKCQVTSGTYCGQTESRTCRNTQLPALPAGHGTA